MVKRKKTHEDFLVLVLKARFVVLLTTTLGFLVSLVFYFFSLYQLSGHYVLGLIIDRGL
jgi:hypothetical protein